MNLFLCESTHIFSPYVEYNHICFSSDVYLKDLTYQTIYINGEIDGVKDLHIGSGVNVQLGEMVLILNIYIQLFANHIKMELTGSKEKYNMGHDVRKPVFKGL